MNITKVDMAEVPAPTAAANRSRFTAIQEAIDGLPPGEKQAIKVACASLKEVHNVKVSCQRHFRVRGRRLLTSRDLNTFTIWLWLMDKGKK